MNDNSDPTQPSPRRKKTAVIVIAAAIGFVCLIVAYLLVSRSAASAPGKSVQTTATIAETYARHNARAIAATPTAPPPQNQSAITSAWKVVMDNLAKLLKGDKVEVCGLSDFDAALFVAGDNEVGTGVANATLAQMTGKLVGSVDAREHMLGLYMQAHLAEWAANRAETSKYRVCAHDTDCIIKLLSTNERTYPQPVAKATTAAPLVSLAIASPNPDHIAAAIYACGGSVTGACGLITAIDWARIEPNNAAAWLRVADAAHFRKDTAARNDALRRAAGASDYDLRIPSLASVADSSLFKGQTALVRDSIGGDLFGLHSLVSIPPTYAAMNYCLHDQSLDASRNALCDKIAGTLMQRDNSVIGLSMALAIATKIGWDAARLQTMRDEKVVGLGLMFDAAVYGNRFSCASLARDLDYLDNALAKSERAIGRERIANSGKTFAEFAAHYREKYPGLAK